MGKATVGGHAELLSHPWGEKKHPEGCPKWKTGLGHASPRCHEDGSGVGAQRVDESQLSPCQAETFRSWGGSGVGQEGETPLGRCPQSRGRGHRDSGFGGDPVGAVGTSSPHADWGGRPKGREGERLALRGGVGRGGVGMGQGQPCQCFWGCVLQGKTWWWNRAS